MKLGEVIKKEREKRRRTVEEMAATLQISESEYSEIEEGKSPLEVWAMRLAQMAITLGVPTSRLIDEEGPYGEPAPGKCHRLIREAREQKGMSIDDFAKAVGLSVEEYKKVEAGDTPLETWGARLLWCAKMVDQPIFNFMYPCGLPYDTLDDYP